MKTIVVYYSQSGNTEMIARRIAEVVEADIELLETVKPYTGSYQKIVDDAQNEVERNHQRPVKPLKHDIRNYDRIIVGTPTWWYKMSSPILTFLTESDFRGKVVVPFMTNAGGLARSSRI
jgi:flavodoxin